MLDHRAIDEALAVDALITDGPDTIVPLVRAESRQG